MTHGAYTRLCSNCKQQFDKPIAYNKLSRLKAHLYDIARWRVGHMHPSAKVFEDVCDDFKRPDWWPRYTDPAPDYCTGEVLYRPKHSNDLTDKEYSGVMQWLVAYMDTNNIPSHGPVDNWQTPEAA